MKKLISILVVLVMTASIFSVTVFAAEPGPTPSEDPRDKPGVRRMPAVPLSPRSPTTFVVAFIDFDDNGDCELSYVYTVDLTDFAKDLPADFADEITREVPVEGNVKIVNYNVINDCQIVVVARGLDPSEYGVASKIDEVVLYENYLYYRGWMWRKPSLVEIVTGKPYCPPPPELPTCGSVDTDFTWGTTSFSKDSQVVGAYCRIYLGEDGGKYVRLRDVTDPLGISIVWKDSKVVCDGRIIPQMAYPPNFSPKLPENPIIGEPRIMIWVGDGGETSNRSVMINGEHWVDWTALVNSVYSMSGWRIDSELSWGM